MTIKPTLPNPSVGLKTGKPGGTEPMNLDPKVRALIARTLVGIFLVEVPILTIELSKPDPDYRLLALGLLGGLAAYLDKMYSPQLADHILPGAVADVPAPLPTPGPPH